MRPAIVVSLVLLCCQGRAQDRGAEALKREFRDPPREYSMEPLWSWNSTLEPAKLTWQIDQMMEKGVYGAFMHARDGLDQGQTPYFSEGFWNAVKTSVEHAEKRGFRAWIYDEDKWPSGAAGGRTIPVNPERFKAQGLEHHFREVRGPARVPLALPEAVYILASRRTGEGSIDPASTIDLTPQAASAWQAPAGEWYLSWFTPVRARVELPNYLNPDTSREFIRNTYDQYAARFSRHFGKTTPGVFFDEIYNLKLAWDPLLAERFRRNKGYDLLTALPMLYFDAGPRAIKVRCDYFDEMTKLYEEAWFKQLSEWCAKNNLLLTGHTNEPLFSIRDQGDYFRTWRHPQIPGTDNEDFRYTFPRVIGSWKPKQLSSVAHAYGRPRAMVEALGGAGWIITPDQTRYGVNMLAAYGMNHYVFHLFHYAIDTVESMDDWPNSWFYENPYWKYFKKLADYVRRVSYLGSQGRHVADVAILYPVEEVWSTGMKDAERSRPPVEQLVDRLMREQIDCDLVDTDSIVKATPAGAGAAIGSESYRVLILPDVETVSLAAYRRLAALADKGFTVLALGRTPRHSAENGGDDPEVMRISARLLPAGSVFRDMDALTAALRSQLAADFSVLAGNRDALRYLHRRAGNADIYFVANAERLAATWRVRLAAAGAAERWDPETGEASPVTPAAQTATHTTLDLALGPWQAFYLVFTPGKPAVAKAAAAGTLGPIELNGPWTMQLAPTELDYAWKPDPGETRVAVPVVDFRVVRAGSESAWRRVKISDALNPSTGASRYLSAWDAPWITRYFYHRNHPGEIGGKPLTFRTAVSIPFTPSTNWLCLAASGEFAVSVNGTAAGKGTVPATLDALPFRAGRNTIEVTVSGAGFLLAQGEIRGPNGELVPLRTSSSWTVEAPDTVPAYEFAWPPFGEWGDIPLRGRTQTLPAGIEYRLIVPRGAFALEPPEVRGLHQIFLNDRPYSGVLAGGATLLIRVEILRPSDGLQSPLVFRCRAAPALLGDWQESGLDWYSGRAIYRTSFSLPASYSGQKLTLNLGQLCHSGEVWINGKLAGTLLWPPYRLDVSEHLRTGSNEVSIVAANLLANQMRWNIFDSAVSRPVSRWWHDGNLLRESENLRSGLIGPVVLEAGDPPSAPRAGLVPVALGHARNSINSTIFCQPLASHGDTQYIAFYDADGYVVLGKRKLGSTQFETRRTPYKGNIRDAHNGIAIGVDGNGILHMSWDHHGNPLNYAQSKAPGSLELTSKLPMTGAVESRVTYPEFFALPGGDLLFLYRDGGSGRGNTILKRYDHRARQWSTVQDLLINGEGARNAYTNRLAVGADGAWHLSWVWRELGDASTNHDICYARSDDQGKTWRKSNGEVYSLPITVRNAEIVHAIPVKSDLINTGTMALDPQGRPMIATWWRPKGARGPEYHLVWFDGTRWQANQIGSQNVNFTLAGGGTRSIPLSRPLVLCDKDGRVLVVFRSETRGNVVSLAETSDPRRAQWRITDLTSEPLDRWEPTNDQGHRFHLFYQRVGQGDGEAWSQLPPQQISVLKISAAGR